MNADAAAITAHDPAGEQDGFGQSGEGKRQFQAIAPLGDSLAFDIGPAGADVFHRLPGHPVAVPNLDRDRGACPAELAFLHHGTGHSEGAVGPAQGIGHLAGPPEQDTEKRIASTDLAGW